MGYGPDILLSGLDNSGLEAELIVLADSGDEISRTNVPINSAFDLPWDSVGTFTMKCEVDGAQVASRRIAILPWDDMRKAEAGSVGVYSTSFGETEVIGANVGQIGDVN